jgi:hypothetical protein
MESYAPWWRPRLRWQSRVNQAYSGPGSWWCFIDAEPVYPDAGMVGGDLDTRSSFGMRPCTGEFDFDDVSIETASAAAPGAG